MMNEAFELFPEPTTAPMNAEEARKLTDAIRNEVDRVWRLLIEAHDRRAWAALGYASWQDYVRGEFDMSRARSYQIIDRGRVIKAIAEATGDVSTKVDITERAARELKPMLPRVAEAVRDRVDSGEAPDEAVAEVVAEARRVKAEQKAERERVQAENDAFREASRVRLAKANPALAAIEAAKARNGSVHAAVPGTVPAPDDEHPDAIRAERDELREENAALRRDVAERDAKIAKFDDMAVQWEQGGFKAVVATKDERIRVLQRQVEDMSADRASAVKSRDYWRKQALALGYVSPNEQVEEPVIDQAALDEAF